MASTAFGIAADYHHDVGADCDLTQVLEDAASALLGYPLQVG